MGSALGQGREVLVSGLSTSLSVCLSVGCPRPPEEPISYSRLLHPHTQPVGLLHPFLHHSKHCVYRYDIPGNRPGAGIGLPGQ